MWKDPIVDDVRKVRRRLEKKFGSDREAFLKYIYEQESKSGRRLVSRSPKKRLARKVA
jgi:hypothetical protein